ncbi:MAG: hypothetical protein JNL10_09195 [Verrucomicrobiales bacterium]|nr:hypothetical protein [Verrucomicrobiales bacterium]
MCPWIWKLAGTWTLLAWAAGAAEPAPRWWKGNLHTHTLWSDGDEFPEVVAEWYRDQGYHFLALSDHNVLLEGERWINLTNVAARARGEPWRGRAHPPADAFGNYLRRYGPAWVETRSNPTNGEPQVRLKPLGEVRARVEVAGRFLMLPAEEITHNAANRKAIHIGAINLLDWMPTQDGATVPEVIARTLRAVHESATRRGTPVLIHVNHPNYKWGVTAEDLAAVVEENFFEVWNGVDGDNDPGDAFHPPTDLLWDIANTIRLAALDAPPLFAVATDDSHDYQGTKLRARPGRAWVMVRCRHLSPESLIRAMNAGDVYASTGVVLDEVTFDPEARRLSLRIAPQRGERFVTRFIGTRRGANLRGKPRLDATGQVLETTLDYRTDSGPQMGEVLAEVKGRTPAYTLRGDELYVRAVVTSSGAPEVPSTEFPFKRAWTQPVGWREHLSRP